ncbi:uncharacterized protein BXZ73DRAFT_102276 [Epithele typhae]|uniref:uncharacterized protein n=1 Tax=Epithele typhae TaxID=378194 RepID=UPI0020079784|nr:uncharacterized protein BXZ73DRAFT_102276 [Epithele typhae]KAH9928435.1 hypothetical protein BXZ73DRAFT_102276 [Epithele typhae]
MSGPTAGPNSSSTSATSSTGGPVGSDSPPSNISAIVGGVVGGTVLLVGLSVVFFILRRRQRVGNAARAALATTATGPQSTTTESSFWGVHSPTLKSDDTGRYLYNPDDPRTFPPSYMRIYTAGPLQAFITRALSAMTKLIAVCDATGNQRGAVAKLLVQHPSEYSVSAALAGCWGVFGVTNFYDTKIKDDPGSEERQGKNLVDAALEHGLECFVWSTLPSSDKPSGGRFVSRIYEGKHRVDDYMCKTGRPGTFIYTGNFYENMIFRLYVKYDEGQDRVEFTQAIINEDTKLAMLYVQKDLSAVTKAVFDNWDTHRGVLNHQYLDGQEHVLPHSRIDWGPGP